MKNIEVKKIMVGMIMTNCLLVINKTTKETIVIDPGYETDKINEAIVKFECKPVAILLTHGHFDHIMAVDDIRDRYHTPVYLYEDEKALMEDEITNHSAKYKMSYTTKADEYVVEGQELNIADIHIVIMHTPGHTSGSCCFYLPEEEVLISGDTLFYGTVGRTDFETSSDSGMKTSIKRLLSELPDEVEVYPGHGKTTTIGYEKRYNPFA